MTKSERLINASKGRRYTANEKAEIIAFIDQVNAEMGRGGQTAASKKFKISPLTISGWRNHAGTRAESFSSAEPIGKNRCCSSNFTTGFSE